MTNARWFSAFLALLLASCFQDSTPQRSTFLPIDPQSSLQVGRTCRPVPDHDLAYQRVLVNDVGADPYMRGNPLPVGAVVVAEQHADTSCSSLTGFYLMAKEKPGYDTAAGDWHWQRIDANQRVLEDGKLQQCSSCHAKPPCTDYLCSPQ